MLVQVISPAGFPCVLLCMYVYVCHFYNNKSLAELKLYFYLVSNNMSIHRSYMHHGTPMITFFRFMMKLNFALYTGYFSIMCKMVLVSKSASSRTNTTTAAANT